MELVPVNPHVDLGSMLDSQRELFHLQIEQLQKIVVTQCRLTGVNPLSQEMAAGALSINIGKRPRDLLNPKAIKYMQSVFSIKDTIGKKETRQICAIYGLTLTQVRDYFAIQRSKLRKSIRLSREKAQKFNEPKPSDLHVSKDDVDAFEIVEYPPMSCKDHEMSNTELLTASICSGQECKPLECPRNKFSVEGTTRLSLEEVIPDIDLEDRKFLDNIFTLMRKEHTFAGQAKLIEWVHQINNSAILYWFLTKGGATILASWLSQSALEEQTSMILIIFKVLCHLPLQKASPEQLSSILQTVNKLRFYRTSDISNKARFLLSRWSKWLVRNHAVRKSFSKSNGFHGHLLIEERKGELLSDVACQNILDKPEMFALDASECDRKEGSKQILKLLTASCDSPTRKHGRITSAMKTKERRKVLLVEHPDHFTGRNTLVSRAVPANVSRPLSADDIQKAKARASLMQNKHGKADGGNHEQVLAKIKDKMVSASKDIVPNLTDSMGNEVRKSSDDRKYKSDLGTFKFNDPKPVANFGNSLLEKLRSHQVPWRKPPEMAVQTLWRLGTGEKSKELEIQAARNRREPEAVYPNANEIPKNPKEPWDLEMDFDDSLTPQIPTEQLPDEEEERESPAAERGGNAAITTDTDSMTLGSHVTGKSVIDNTSEFLSLDHSVHFSSQTNHSNVNYPSWFSSRTDCAGMANSLNLPQQAEHVSTGNLFFHPHAEHASVSKPVVPSPETELANIGNPISFPQRTELIGLRNRATFPPQTEHVVTGNALPFSLQTEHDSTTNPLPVPQQTKHVCVGSLLPFLPRTEHANVRNSGPFAPSTLQQIVGSSMPFSAEVMNAGASSSVHLPSQHGGVIASNPSLGSCIPVSSWAEGTSTANAMSRTDVTAMDGCKIMPSEKSSYERTKVLEPDVELLAVLLKNPNLVFALTSGQANGLTESQTVMLLDSLKKAGGGLDSLLSRFSGHLTGQSNMTRLPSPTPPEPLLDELQQDQKTVASSTLQYCLPESSREPTSICAIESRPFSHMAPAADVPLLQKDPFLTSLPSQSFTQVPSTACLSSRYDPPTHHSPANGFLKNEHPFFSSQSISLLTETRHLLDDPLPSTKLFRFSDIDVPSLSRGTSVAQRIVGSSPRQACDYRSADRHSSRIVSSPPRNSPAALLQSLPQEPPSSRSMLWWPASASGCASVAAPPVAHHLPNSSADATSDSDEGRFSGHRTHRRHDQYRSRSPCLSPKRARTGSDSDSYVFDSWSRRKEDAMSRQNHHTRDHDREHPSRKKMSSCSDNRRDRDHSRHHNHSRHSPSRRRWRNHDRRR